MLYGIDWSRRVSKYNFMSCDSEGPSYDQKNNPKNIDVKSMEKHTIYLLYSGDLILQWFNRSSGWFLMFRHGVPRVLFFLFRRVLAG